MGKEQRATIADTDRKASVDEPVADHRAGDRAAGVVHREEARDDAATRTGVVRTSLLAAQHWLDTGANLLGGKDDFKVIAETRRQVDHYFTTATSVVSDHGGGADAGALMDETSRAYMLFVERVLLGDRADEASQLLKKLDAQHGRLRELLGLPVAIAAGAHLAAVGTNDTYEQAALGPILDLVRDEANTAFRALRNDGDRDAIVHGAVAKLVPYLDHAAYVFAQHAGDDAAFIPQLDDASIAILEIDRWLEKREATGPLTTAFRTVMRKVDKLRTGLDLEAIKETPVQLDVFAGEDTEAAEEVRVLDEAQTKYTAKLHTAFAGIKLGADRFLKFAELQRPPEPPPFWEELAKAAVIAALGAASGPLVGAIAKKVVDVAKHEAVVDFVKDTLNDTAQAALHGAADRIFDGARGRTDANAKTRDRVLFYEAQVEALAVLTELSVTSIAAARRHKTITPAELGALVAQLDDDNNYVADLTYRHFCTAYAKHIAASSLGTRPGATTDMTKFFGSEPGDLLQYEDRSKATGVARVVVDVSDSGSDAGFKIRRFEVQGMNGEMAAGVLEQAGYSISKLELPLVVDCNGPSSSLGDIAIDEHGTLRSSSRWRPEQARVHGAVPLLPEPGEPERNPNGLLRTSFYETPERMWKTLREHEIPKGSVKLS